MARKEGHHEREALKHGHTHYDVTHYLHRGENWGHLLSTHAHEHNHPALEHVHIPHRWPGALSGEPDGSGARSSVRCLPGEPVKERRRCSWTQAGMCSVGAGT
jgi:hypothetical protein